MIKRGFSFIFALSLIANASASSIDYFVDINSLVLIGIFLFIFYIAYFAITKTMRYGSPSIKIMLAFGVALFTVWKVNMNIDLDSMVFDLGLYGFLEAYGPIIIIVGLIIAMFIWGFCGVMAIAGGIFAAIGYVGQESGALYNGWALIIAGLVMFFLGLLCVHRKHIKDAARYLGGIKGPKIKIGFCGFFTLVGLILLVIGIISSNIMLIVPGVILFILGLWCPGKKRYPDGASSRWSSGWTPDGKSSSWSPNGASSRWSPRDKYKYGDSSPWSPRKKEDEEEKKKKRIVYGKARFDLYAGNNQYSSPSGRLNELVLVGGVGKFTIKNGGTGGTLRWKAAASKGIVLTRTHGALKKGQTHDIGISISGPPSRNQKITVFAKIGTDNGGIRDFIHKAVAKVRIPIRVKF